MSGELPSGWSHGALGSISTESRERFLPGANSDDDVPYVGLEHIEPGVSRVRNFGSASDVSSQKTKFRLGDILFGKLRPYLKKVAQVDRSGVCSTDILAIRPRPGTDAGFLLSLLSDDEAIHFAMSTAAGTKMPRTSWSALSAYPVLVPPLPEQKNIAAILSSVDDAIRATQAVIDQTRRVKEGLLQELLGSNSWPTKRIDDVGAVQLGQQRHPQFASGNNVRPYLRVANVLDGEIDFTDLNDMHFPEDALDKFELRAGDILLNEGQSLHLVGRSAIYRGEVDGLCVQKTLLRYRCGPAMLPDFAQAVFQWWLKSGVFARVAVQTTSMAHLTGVRFSRMLIPVPPLPEQYRVIQAAELVASGIREGTETLQALQRSKAGLLSDLLTGRVRVTP